MKVKSESEKALEYLASKEKEFSPGEKTKGGPCITVSRQSGAGSGIVDENLRHILQKATLRENVQWTVFDKNLIEKVLEDHNLPQRLGKFLTAENTSSISTIMNELLGIHPSMRTLLHKTSETILQLAHFGYVIIVGRAANIITAGLPNVLHVRLVAPLDNRVKRIQEYYNLDKKGALEYLKKEDFSRESYYLKNFHKSVDDPLLYHLTLNTGLLSYEQAAGIIAEAAVNKFPSFFRTQFPGETRHTEKMNTN